MRSYNFSLQCTSMKKLLLVNWLSFRQSWSKCNSAEFKLELLSFCEWIKLKREVLFLTFRSVTCYSAVKDEKIRDELSLSKWNFRASKKEWALTVENILANLALSMWLAVRCSEEKTHYPRDDLQEPAASLSILHLIFHFTFDLTLESNEFVPSSNSHWGEEEIKRQTSCQERDEQPDLASISSLINS